jgi:hypothetical protein
MATWKVLEAKLQRILPSGQTSKIDTDFQACLASPLGEKTPASSLFPSSILEGAPHLQSSTWELL